MLEVVEEPLTPGVVLAGRYTLREILGEGGMGVVWTAHDARTNRLVAVKLLRGESARDPKRRERFMREARASISIVHPNVARIHEVGETATGAPFMVMDRLEGESLRGRLARGRVSPADCAWIFRGVLEAVTAAHRLGIVHRDLKPENVFLAHAPGPTPGVFVLDFGIAKSLIPDDGAPSLTSTGSLVGTPQYMAPEQVFGDADVDTRVDVWALGVMLHECLAGRRPTEGANLGQILKIIAEEHIVPLARVAPEVPPELAAMVDRMLKKDRALRPTLPEIAGVLRRFGGASAHDPALAPTVPFRPPTTTAGLEAPASRPASREARPGGAIVLALGAIVVLLALATAGGVVGYRSWLASRADAAISSASPSSASVDPPRVAAPTISKASTAVAPATTGSAAPSASAKLATTGAPRITPSPPPSASASARPGKPPHWDAGFGNHHGFSAADDRDIHGTLRRNAPSLQECLPPPGDGFLHTTGIRFVWPKGAPAVVRVTVYRTREAGADLSDLDFPKSAGAAPMQTCVEAKVKSWNVPHATGQHYNDGGASDLVMTAGWYRTPF